MLLVFGHQPGGGAPPPPPPPPTVWTSPQSRGLLLRGVGGVRYWTEHPFVVVSQARGIFAHPFTVVSAPAVKQFVHPFQVKGIARASFEHPFTVVGTAKAAFAHPFEVWDGASGFDEDGFPLTPLIGWYEPD